MARNCCVLIGPASSTGSPITFMMRPSVSGPTGTEIGSAVSVTSCPRTSPSVVSIAMVRTVFSPRCWATSRISRLPLLLVSSAFRMAGNWSWNCTSTTAPVTRVMRPVTPLALAVLGFAIVVSFAVLLERLGARNDLDQFLGNLRLAAAVVEQRVAIDHVAGVARCVVHGAHFGALLRGHVFEERPQNLDRQVARQQIGKDRFLVGLILIDGAITGHLWRRAADLRRDKLPRRRHLRDHRTEGGVEERRHVELALGEKLQHARADLLGVAEADLLDVAQLDHLDDLPCIEPAEDIVALLADAQELDVLALCHQAPGVVARHARDRRIERARKTAIAGAHDEKMRLALPGAD